MSISKAEEKQHCPDACTRYVRDLFARTFTNTFLKPGKECDLAATEPVRVFKEGVCSRTAGLQAALPADAALQGPVDFGRSFAKVEVSEEDDRFESKVAGKIAVVGGNCAGQQCPIEIWYVWLTPVDNPITTDQGHTVADLVALNEGVWSGTKNADNTFVLSPQSFLSLSATIDGTRKITTMNPNAYFKGRIAYGMVRPGSPTPNNALIVEGDFENEDAKVELHVHAWITNCQPFVNAQAACFGIDPGDHNVRLSSSFGLLGNLHSQDLCNAMRGC